MPITPTNLIYHEIIGLPVWAYPVKQSKANSRPVAGGVVIDETRQTIVIETGNHKRKCIIKQTHLFRFTLEQPNGMITVDVPGTSLLGRPEKRLKNLRRVR